MRINSAIVLCGGLGTRLQAVVGDRPKPLALVNGRPFLTYLLDRLAEAGIQQVILSAGYKVERIEELLGKAYRSISLDYSVETEPLGTGGALRFALPLIAESPAFVLNGDSYLDFDFADYFAWHRRQPLAASLVAAKVDDAARFGSLLLAGERIVAFEEKKPPGLGSTSGHASSAGWINAGLYLLPRSHIESIPAARPISLERDCFPAWLPNGLAAFQVQARFLDIGTPESYAAADSFLARL